MIKIQKMGIRGVEPRPRELQSHVTTVKLKSLLVIQCLFSSNN